MAKFSQANRPLKLHILNLGDDDAVLPCGVEGGEAISTLFAFRLEFLALASNPLSFTKVLGQAATAEIVSPEGGSRYVNGIISEITETERGKSFIHYRAELVPAFWYWQHRVRSRIFQWTSVPDILNTVLNGLNFSAPLSPGYPLRNYCVQYQESDFAFASRLMEAEGIWYSFEHTLDQHVLLLSDASANSRNVADPRRFGSAIMRGRSRE